jgi:hypothetical protein
MIAMGEENLELQGESVTEYFKIYEKAKIDDGWSLVASLNPSQAEAKSRMKGNRAGTMKN